MVKVREVLKIKERVNVLNPKNKKLPDPNNCKLIQKLYCNNSRKVLRVILDNDSDFCDLDPAEVATHYSGVNSVCDGILDYLRDYTCAHSTLNADRFTRREVKSKLFACGNT